MLVPFHSDGARPHRSFHISNIYTPNAHYSLNFLLICCAELLLSASYFSEGSKEVGGGVVFVGGAVYKFIRICRE